jgi:hypothetical protein
LATPTGRPTGGATATATGPDASPSPSLTPDPTATATAIPDGLAVVEAIFVSGPQAELRRMAFAPGEAISLWLRVRNDGAAPVQAVVDYTVVGEGGFGVDSLSYNGPLEVPPGATWFRLERTVPSGPPSGPYRFLGGVTAGGRRTGLEHALYLTGQRLRYDDFEDTASGWPTEERDTVGWGYLDGGYRIRVKADDWWARVIPIDGPSAAHVALEADLRLLGGAYGAAALLFGLAANGEDFGVFEVFPDGRYAVYRRLAGTWRTLVPPTASAALGTGEQVNHLLLVRRGRSMTLYANGELLGTAEDLTAESGWLGVYGWGQRAGLDARFDNWGAYALPAP